MGGYMDAPTHLSEKDAAAELGVTVLALREATDKGLIPALRLGRTRLYRVELIAQVKRAAVTWADPRLAAGPVHW